MMTSSETMMNLDALLGVEEETEETMGTTVDASSSSSSSSSSVASVVERNSAERNSNSTAALWTLEDVVERPDPLATHDPERDWLGAGPRWDVKWGVVRFVLTMLAVDASFYVAGFFAPVYTYVGMRAEEMIPSDPVLLQACLLYTSPSPRDRTRSRMPSSA